MQAAGELTKLLALFDQVLEAGAGDDRTEARLASSTTGGQRGFQGSTLSGPANGRQGPSAVALPVARALISAVSPLFGSGGDVVEDAARLLAGRGAGDGASVAGRVGRTVAGGLGLAPLLAGIWGLLWGRKEPELPELTRYLPPTPVRISAAYRESAGVPEFAEAAYDERSRPRVVGGGFGNEAGSARVVVQVNALDTQSFLDRSDEIALAVRRAMLNMNPLNDVVADL